MQSHCIEVGRFVASASEKRVRAIRSASASSHLVPSPLEAEVEGQSQGGCGGRNGAAEKDTSCCNEIAKLRYVEKKNYAGKAELAEVMADKVVC